jgi:hypothetical protein
LFERPHGGSYFICFNISLEEKNMKTKNLVIAMLSLGALALMACDNDNDDDDPKVHSSVEESKQMKELTPDEAKALDESMQEAIEKSMTKERLCMVGAVMATTGFGQGTPQACQDAYNECLKKKQPAAQGSLTEGTKTFNLPQPSENSNCSATVKEFESCMKAG